MIKIKNIKITSKLNKLISIIFNYSYPIQRNQVKIDNKTINFKIKYLIQPKTQVIFRITFASIDNKLKFQNQITKLKFSKIVHHQIKSNSKLNSLRPNSSQIIPYTLLNYYSYSTISIINQLRF